MVAVNLRTTGGDAAHGSVTAGVAEDGRSWGRVRADFPVTEKFTYLRSAATGPLAPNVAAEVAHFHDDLTTTGDCEWERWIARREEARAAIARMINAEPEEVAFTVNTSQGMNLIVDACERHGAVVSCELEFPVSTLPWLHRGIEVNRLTAHGGVLEISQIEEALKDAGVICLSHVQYSNGLRLDLNEVGERKRDRVFVVNASQSAGVLPIDVKRMKIDALCATGHKWLLAGFGTGFVYMSRELLDSTRPRAMSWMSTPDPFAMRNDDPTVRADTAARAEIGVPTFPSIFAIGASVAYLSSISFEKIEQRALEPNRLLTARLADEGFQILSPLRDEVMRSAETLVAARDSERVAHSLAARGVLVTQKPEGIRVATHFFNNETDVEQLILALKAA